MSHVLSDELVKEFPKRLALATSEKPLIIFLDALDQLSKTNNAKNLNWLPTELPEYVKLIVSTISILPNGSQEECYKVMKEKLTEESLLELTPMPSEEGEELLDVWLEKDAHRVLQPGQRQEVLGNFKQNKKPLYLKLAFEEARRWKSYTPEKETALSPDISGIIQDLFKRLSSEKNHGEMMVSRSLGYLAAGKNGLSEDELIDILSEDEEFFKGFLNRAFHTPPENRLPVIVWSRLYFDLEPYIIEISADGTSLMTFYHPTSIGNEVKKKFLSGTAKLDRHQKLARYFREQPLAIEKDDQKISNLRKLSELPYQQARANLWEELVKTLTDFNFLEKKARAVGPWLLIDDYTEGAQAGCKNKDLPIVQEALRLSAHVLINDPDQIASQLIGRLLAYYPSSFKSLIDQATQWRGAPWFCPLQSRLIIPGGPLHCTLTGHTGTVISLALTSDGKFAVSGGADGTLRLWDLKQWKLLKSLKLPSGIGEQVSTRLTGLQIYGGLQAAMGISRDVPTPNSIALTHDSRFAILSIAGDKTIWIWDIIKDELAYILKGHHNVVFSVAVTLDGKYAVSGGADGAVLLWNLNMAREKEIHPIHAFIKHSDMVSSVDITDDGLAVSGSMDKTIRVWDIEKRKLKRTIHTGRPILGLAVVSNTQRVASFSLNTIDVWDINKPVSWMKSIRRKGMLSTVAGFKRSPLAWAVTPDGSRSITYCEDETLRVSDLKKGEFLSDWAHNIYDLITSIVVTPDGNYALTGSVNQTISVWNLRASANLQTATDHKRSVRAVAITSDGHLAVSGSLDGQIKVWDIEQKKVIRTLDGHTDAVMSIAIIPDGRYAVSGSRDKTVRVWDLNQGNQICNLSGHHNSVNAVAIMKNGRYAVSGSRDNTVKVWDIKKKECLETYNDHEDIVGALAMTMDGTRMITVASDETMRIWDLNLSKNIEKLDSHNINEFLIEALKGLGKPDSRVLARHKGKGLINTVAMTQDGKFAVTGGLDGSVKVWDVNEMKEIHTLQEKSKSVWSVAITPEGKSFLLSTEGPRLKIWDMESWKVKASFNGDSDFLSCAIVADGVKCIAGDANGQVHIFRLEGLD